MFAIDLLSHDLLLCNFSSLDSFKYCLADSALALPVAATVLLLVLPERGGQSITKKSCGDFYRDGLGAITYRIAATLLGITERIVGRKNGCD
jgi:hypothetical protein